MSLLISAAQLYMDIIFFLLVVAFGFSGVVFVLAVQYALDVEGDCE